MRYNKNATARGASISGEGEILSFPPFRIGYQAPTTTGVLNTLSARAADLKERIVTEIETWTLCGRLPGEVPPEDLLEDVNVALLIITETNQLIYTIATVITEMLGYKMNSQRSSMLPEKDITHQDQGSTEGS